MFMSYVNSQIACDLKTTKLPFYAKPHSRKDNPYQQKSSFDVHYYDREDKLSSSTENDSSEDWENFVEKIIASSAEKLTESGLHHLLPLERSSTYSPNDDAGKSWYRTSNIDSGLDGALFIDVGQLAELDVQDAADEVLQQALIYNDHKSEFAKCDKLRTQIEELFSSYQSLMKLEEIGCVTEDGFPMHLVKFTMLDDNINLISAIRIAGSQDQLLNELHEASRLHDFRLSILHAQHNAGCSYFIDACASTALAWSGLDVDAVLSSLVSEHWITTDLYLADSIVAKATIYIENCILTAHIVGVDGHWQMRGSDLLLRDNFSCVQCKQDGNFRAIRMNARSLVS